MIFNKFIQEEHVPPGWNDVHVTALHKKGSKSNRENYRQISLTAVCCKLWNHFIETTL